MSKIRLKQIMTYLKNPDFLSKIIPLIFFIILLPLACLHNSFGEYDGILMLFSGREILKGLGYQGFVSHFWPPLYPLLIGFFDLFMDGFWAAKLVSMLASTILLSFVYLLAKEIFERKSIGIWAQVFLVLNPLYIFDSIRADNHLLEAMFYIVTLTLFLKFLKVEEEKKKIIFLVSSAITLALTCLSRYTSYALFQFIYFFFLSSLVPRRGLNILFFLLPFLSLFSCLG